MTAVPIPRGKIREGYSLFSCGKNGCTLRVLVPDNTYPEHKCPHWGGETRISWMSYGPTLLQATWDELDSLFEEYMNAVQNHNPEGFGSIADLAGMKGRMRGVASVLARFMVPHLNTEDEVVREVQKRYRMRQAGETYETPGLGSRTYEPPPSDDKLARTPPKPTVAIPSSITDADAAKIRAAKGFPLEILAASYGTTVQVIKALQSQ